MTAVPAGSGGGRDAADDPLQPELLPTGEGRLVADRWRVRLGDVTPTGRARLDSLARWAQDIASEDLRRSGVDDGAIWVVRRSAMVIARRPRFGEELEVSTWITGAGAAWAQRRTSLAGTGGAAVEAVALWVHLDPATARPRPMTPEFRGVWAPGSSRHVRARLVHPRAPSPLPPGRPLQLRLADYDLAGHVNNAVAWAVLEDELVRAAGAHRRVAVASVEYLDAIDPGAQPQVHSSGDGDRLWCWMTGADGAVLVSAVARTEPGVAVVGADWPVAPVGPSVTELPA
jgi:acyl-ACP thioesterase